MKKRKRCKVYTQVSSPTKTSALLKHVTTAHVVHIRDKYHVEVLTEKNHVIL